MKTTPCEPGSGPIGCTRNSLSCCGRSLLAGVLCTGLFVSLSWRPLWHTDLWGHLAYGRFISDNAHAPDFEPFLMLASEKRFVDTAWLSQSIGYEVFESLGVGGIQWLYAASIALCAMILVRSLLSKTQSILWSVAGCALFLYVDWQQLLIVRPQLAGLICFIALFVRLNCRRHWIDWLFVPALFAAWANLHGSFVMGWALISAHALEHLLDRIFYAKHATGENDLRSLPAWLLLLLIAMAATLLNPYGLDLHREVWAVARNPNLTDLIEWQSLLQHEKQRLAFLIAVVALLVVAIGVVGWRSPRRIATADVILLVGLGVAALWTSRMILWWAPIAGWSFAIHGSACWRAAWENRFEATLNARSWQRSVAFTAMLIAGFACTPAGVAKVTGQPLGFENCVSDQTPIGAAEYLRQRHSDRLVFNTYEWGDYLLWASPGVRVFVNSHAHLVPPEVWRDYVRVSRAEPGWDATLDHYHVEFVVIDPFHQSELAAALRAHKTWLVAFEDDRSIIFERKTARTREPDTPF